MALPLFQSFYPTAVKWNNTAFRQEYRLLTDDRTGSPVGMVSQNANGPQGIWAPTPLTSDQIANPTAAMLADINATYQLDEAPYSRYYSDGTQLLPLGEGGGTIIPAGQIQIFASPFVVYEDHPVTIQGGIRVIE
jgi:hypothetical protein